LRHLKATNSDELNFIRESAKDFAKKEILPNVMKWDEAQFFPVEIFKKMG
jgi:hypothetical protein